VSTTEENKAQFRRAYEEVLDQGDVLVVDELIAPDFLNHAAPPGRDRGPESLRWLATMLRTAFPDLRFTIEELVAEGDIVAGRLTMSGTHEGPLTGIPPTGHGATGSHAFCEVSGRQSRRALGGEGRPRHDAAAGRHPRAGKAGGPRPYVELIHRSSWK
jgi:predicted ester cyclase